MKIGTSLEPRTLEDRLNQVNRGARRGGRFEHHQIALPQKREDGFSSGRHGTHIGQFVWFAVVLAGLVRIEWCGNGDQEGIRFFGLGRNGQLAGLECRFDEGAQSRLVDVDATVFERFEHALVDIHPDNLDAVRGKGAGCWQTDVAQAQHTDLLKIHTNSLRVPRIFRCCGMDDFSQTHVLYNYVMGESFFTT